MCDAMFYKIDSLQQKLDKALKQAKFIDEQFKKFVSPIPSKEVADLINILEGE